MTPEVALLESRPPIFQKGLWGVTWPLLASLTLTLSLHFVDAFFLSRISDQAAAAAGAVFPVLGATLVLFVAISQAGSSVAAQLLGARRNADVPPTYLSLIGLNIGLGLCTSFLLFALHGVLPRWLGLEGVTAGYASTYIGILGGFQFVKATQLAFGAILNSRGETKWVLAEAILTNVSNVGLNLLFLAEPWGFRLGVAGVALATVVSLGVGLGFTVCVVRYRLRVRLPWQTPARELYLRLRPILRIGIPSALEPVSYQSAQMIVNLLVISFGAAALAARVYVFNIFLITTMLWGIAFGTATQILIAHHIGAGRFEAAQADLERGLRFGIVGNLVLSGLLAVFHPLLLGILTTDPRVQALASPLFFVAPLVECGRAVNIVAGGALRSSGDARFTSVVGMTMMWCVGVPACYFFGGFLGFGLTGVWLGMGLDEVTRGLVNYWRWRKGRWQDFSVVSRPSRA